MRRDIVVHIGAVPVFDLDESKNSYVLDFYKHGNLEKLEENGIFVSEAEHMLSRFVKDLKKITLQISLMLQQGQQAKQDQGEIQDKVYQCIRVIQRRFMEKLYRDIFQGKPFV